MRGKTSRQGGYGARGVRLERAALLLAVLLLAAGGCRLVGPRTIDVGRVHYNDVIQRTGNEQMLLNLVRLRYSDTPFFLQVASVSTAFQFRSASALGITISPGQYLIGTELEASEEPTITYTPLQGESFVKSMLTPLDLSTLLLLYHSGWAIDRLLRVTVAELNGVPNAPSASGPTPKREPDHRRFLELAELFRDFQRTGDISISGQSTPAGPVLLMKLGPGVVGSSKHRQLAERLGLDPGRDQYELVPDRGQRVDHQIAVVTRSLMAGFFYVSQGVEVPAEDEAAGRVTVTRTAAGEPFDWAFVKQSLFRVRHAEALPEDASIHTHYRDRWFYIADADLETEATFALLNQLFSLQSGNATGGGPILTLPVGR